VTIFPTKKSEKKSKKKLKLKKVAKILKAFYICIAFRGMSSARGEIGRHATLRG
jgi:hypothetical protein